MEPNELHLLPDFPGWTYEQSDFCDGWVLYYPDGHFASDRTGSPMLFPTIRAMQQYVKASGLVPVRMRGAESEMATDGHRCREHEIEITTHGDLGAGKRIYLCTGCNRQREELARGPLDHDGA